MTRRTAAGWLLALTASAAVLSACTFAAEPAPGSPESPDGFSTSGFPPPGPVPAPGQVTPGPAPLPAPSNAPRPERAPVPTVGPETSETEPRPTNNPAPPPGS